MSETSGGGQASLEEVLELVYMYFGGDRQKIDRWLRDPHPQLGGVSPMDKIREGQPELLLELIRDAVEGSPEPGPR